MPPTILNIRWGLGISCVTAPEHLTMDLKIHLDGKPLLDTDMTFAKGSKPDPADFEPHEVEHEGKHILRMETVKGGVIKEQEIVLGASNYLQVNFIYSGESHPSGALGEFSAFIQDRPHYYR